jgi:SAM-dependent methyltransferase
MLHVPMRLRSLLKTVLPNSALSHIARGMRYARRIGLAAAGTQPMSYAFGLDRGQPIDRYYIERFLAAHASDVRGHVLEIEHDIYTRRYGGNRVTKSDILFVEPGCPKANIVADLTNAPHLPSHTYDTIIFTQTLPFIYDSKAVIRTLYRILKPKGVVLCTTPGVCHQISPREMRRWGDYWRFTSLSVQRLFSEVFPANLVKVGASGNVLAASAFLYGLAVEDVRVRDLDEQDPLYEVSIAVRAEKPLDGAPVA